MASTARLTCGRGELEMPVDERQRPRIIAGLENAALWLIGHATKVWPFVVFGLVVALSWQALREIHPRDFAGALHALDAPWLSAATLFTLINVAAMGFYDVVAFRHTRSPWTERWRYGAVTFAWSNFLTLGPLAGPAMRFWLYRPRVKDPADLHDGVVAVATAFTSGLVGWALAAGLGARLSLPFPAVAVFALAMVLCVVS